MTEKKRKRLLKEHGQVLLQETVKEALKKNCVFVENKFTELILQRCPWCIDVDRAPRDFILRVEDARREPMKFLTDATGH